MAIELINSQNNENNKNQNNNFSNFEAEIALIGCILWDNRNYEKISDFLNENHLLAFQNFVISESKESEQNCANKRNKSTYEGRHWPQIPK